VECGICVVVTLQMLEMLLLYVLAKREMKELLRQNGNRMPSTVANHNRLTELKEEWRKLK
jgi:hypothetical protein